MEGAGCLALRTPAELQPFPGPGADRGDGWGPALTPATAQSAAPCRITPTWPARNRATRDVVFWSRRGLGPSGQHRRAGGPATSSLTFPRSRPQVRRRRSRSSTCSEVEARRAESPSGLGALRLYPLSAQTRPPAHQSPSSARDAPASAPGHRGWGLGRRSAPMEMATSPVRLPAGSRARAPRTRPPPGTHSAENSGIARVAGESRAQLLSQRRCQPAHLRGGTVRVGAVLQGHSPERNPAPMEPPEDLLELAFSDSALGKGRIGDTEEKAGKIG